MCHGPGDSSAMALMSSAVPHPAEGTKGGSAVGYSAVHGSWIQT